MLARRPGAAEQGPHARAELPDRERLGDVVVGAELEADDLVELVVAGGQHDDRHRAPGAELLADLEPVADGSASYYSREMAAPLPPVRRRRRPRRGSLERPVSSQLYRSAFLAC